MRTRSIGNGAEIITIDDDFLKDWKTSLKDALDAMDSSIPKSDVRKHSS